MLNSLAGAMRRSGCCVVVALLSPAALQAHVALDSPNGGESLVVGSTFTIEWHPVVEHDTINWDLWYSTASSAGPWEVISMNLPLGNPAQNAPHSFDWLVPDVPDTSAWIQVRQDNDNDQDYFDESDSSFSILAAGDFDASGSVDSRDLLAWEGGYGAAAGAQHSDGDAKLDGDVDGDDFLVWQHQAGGSALRVSISALPEPAAWQLLLLGCGIVACRGRR